MKKLRKYNKYFISVVMLCAVIALIVVFTLTQTSEADVLPSTSIETENPTMSVNEVNSSTLSEAIEQTPDVEPEIEEIIEQLTLAEMRAAGKAFYVSAPFGDYTRVGSLERMFGEADYVVVGRFTAFTNSVNGSRNPANPLQESQLFYNHVRLYNFQIENVLKGNINRDNITIGLTYFRQRTSQISNEVRDSESGAVIHEATEFDTFTINMIDPYFLEPQIGQTVVLFLNHEELFDSYTALFTPHEITINQDGSLSLRCPRTNNEYLPPEESMHIVHSDAGLEIRFRNHGVSHSRIREDFVAGRTVRDLLTGAGIENPAIEAQILAAAAASPPPVFVQPITVTSDGHLAYTMPRHAMPNQMVMISAGMPPEGYVFAGWTSNQGIVFADASAAQTTFTMIGEPAAITANWEPLVTTTPVLSTTIADEDWRTTINIRFFLDGVLSALPIEDVQLVADGVPVANIRDFTVNVVYWQTEINAIFINKLAPPWLNLTVSITAYGQTLTYHFVNNMFVPPAPTHVTIELMDGWDGVLRQCGWCCSTGQLRAIVHPLGADQTVVWSSGAPDVVDVSQDGLVSLLSCCCDSDGYVVITATASNGVSETFTVLIEHIDWRDESDPPLADD